MCCIDLVIDGLMCCCMLMCDVFEFGKLCVLCVECLCVLDVMWCVCEGKRCVNDDVVNLKIRIRIVMMLSEGW